MLWIVDLVELVCTDTVNIVLATGKLAAFLLTC